MLFLCSCSVARLVWIKKILVAVSPEWGDRTKELIRRYNFTKVELVTGGASRHRSIQNGVRRLELEGCAATASGGGHPGRNGEGSSEGEVVVVVHDAVRPFADEDILRRVALAAKEYGVRSLSLETFMGGAQ